MMTTLYMPSRFGHWDDLAFYSSFIKLKGLHCHPSGISQSSTAALLPKAIRLSQSGQLGKYSPCLSETASACPVPSPGTFINTLINTYRKWDNKSHRFFSSFLFQEHPFGQQLGISCYLQKKKGDDFAITGSRWLPAENDANQNIRPKPALPAIWQPELNKYSEPVN